MALHDGRWFKLVDAACKDGTPYPEIYADAWNRLVIRTADPVRDEWGAPLYEVSFYRSPAYNQRLIERDLEREVPLHNVAKSSSHMIGEALDFKPKIIKGKDEVLRLHNMILAKYKRRELPELGGLGLYPGWVHIDVTKAADGHLRRWNTR